MRKTATKVINKPIPKTPRKRTPSVDDTLADHLKQAEHHLIEAIQLFSGPRKPERRVEYYQRLSRAQELITGLYREELVRIRGPVRKRGKK